MKKNSRFITLILITLFTFGTYNSVFAEPAFKAVTYSGTSSNQQITGVGFKPGLVWGKIRNQADNHWLVDSVRGPSKVIQSNNPIHEQAMSGPTSFDTEGFTMPATTDKMFNTSGNSYVAWCWKAGDGIVTNTDGGITSTISINPDAGFSIVKFTGNGIAGSTVGHGLNTVPALIIVKRLNGSESWRVYHSALGATKNLSLEQADAATTVSNRWNNTEPTTSVFSLGDHASVNASGDSYIAYCWTEVPGISSFGSYTGNGSADGPEITLGFQPSFLLIKRIDGGSEDWVLLDGARDPDIAQVDHTLYANLNSSEASPAHDMEFTSTGFKLLNAGLRDNYSGYTYIYMAFSENDVIPPGPPEISHFTTDKTTIDYSNPTDKATLSWEVLNPGSSTITITPAPGAVDASSTLELRPTATTTYTLTVDDGENAPLTSQIQIIVLNGGYNHYGTFSVSEKIGVGVTNPVHALEVNGTVKAKEVLVSMNGWADYVFEKDYDLQDIDAVESYIKANKHLPGIPSADQLEKQGIPMSKMFELQMKKIEELTLYVIQLSKENKELKKLVNERPLPGQMNKKTD